MRRALGLAWAAFWSLPTAFFGWLFYDAYWRWRDCFNEAGRCFDPQSAVVHHEQSWAVLLPAIPCAMAIAAGLLFSRTRRLPDSDASAEPG